MGFTPGSVPGTPGNFLGGDPSAGVGAGSDGSFDLAPNVGPYLSLRQSAVGSVGFGTFDPSPGNHTSGIGDPNNDSLGWTPCEASFTQTTLPGSLLVCLGIITADNFGGQFKPETLNPTFGLDLWGADAPGGPRSVFNVGLPCMGIAGGLDQVPQAAGGLAYRMNAPAVGGGQLFYGGLFGADWCNNFLYQMVLAEFACDGATQAAFSFSNSVLTPGGVPLSVTGRLPRETESFVVGVTWSAGGGAVPGDGFVLGPPSPLGLQWQYQEFEPQPSGYAGPTQWPTGCPGRTGSFELGFGGGSTFGTIGGVGAFIWNLLATGGGGGNGGGGDLNQHLPNVWIVT